MRARTPLLMILIFLLGASMLMPALAMDFG